MKRLKAALKQGFIFLMIPGLLIYLGWTVVSFFDNFWAPLFRLIFGKTPFWGAGFLTTLFLTLVAGFILTSNFFQKPEMAKFTANLWSKIPILKIFFGTEFFSKEDLEKTQAVLVEYPSQGWLQIGFIMGKQKIGGTNELYKIFIPTAPLPVTGLYGMTKIVGGNNIIFLKTPPLEVIKLIFSCGLMSVDLEKLEKEKS